MNEIANIEIEVKFYEMSGNGLSGNGNGNGFAGNGFEPVTAEEFESLLKDFS